MTVSCTIPTALEIRTILTSWSTTLLLDEQSGESNVTELDLDRLASILFRYIEKAHHHPSTINHHPSSITR